MKLIDNTFKLFGYIPETSAKSIDQEGRPRQRATFLTGQAIPPDMKASEYLKAYRGWVYDCVSAISQEVGDIDLVLKRRKTQGEVEIVESHPALDLIHAVNPLYTSYLLWESTQAYIELSGEAFWWLTGTPRNPQEIWLLRPDWLSIRDTKNKMIEMYEYGAPGDKKITIPFEQIVHFKDFNPVNPYRGFGGVKAQADAIDTDNYMRDYNKSFFFNSARPGGALSTDQALTDAQYSQIRSQWDKVHRGQKNAWKVAILEAGLKWADIGLSQKEMDYAEGRRFQRDEIFAGFRVPKSIVAISDDVNLAAIREHMAVFLELTIDPKLKRLVSHLNEFFLPRYGDKNLFFDYVSPVPDDTELKIKTYDNALRHGWMTRNEVRREQGLEDIEGGDKLMIPFSLADVGSQTPEEKAAKATKDLAKFNLRIAPIAHKDFVLQKSIDGITEKAKVMIKSLLLSRAAKTPTKDTTKQPESKVKSDRDARWESMIERTNPREVQMKKVFFELFEAQQDRVLSKVDNDLKLSAKAKKAERERVKASAYEIGDVTGDDDVFAAPLRDLIRGFIEAEGVVQIHELDANAVFYMQSKGVQNYILKESVKFVTAINQETTDQLRQALSDGIGLGEGIPQLTARVRAVFDDAKGFRSESIARTETLRATNFSVLEAYKQSEVVEAKEWLTTKDERLCPFCEPQDGKVFGLGDAFYKKGDTIEGVNEKGKTVTLSVGVADVMTPPLHPNCRCTLIPVLKSTNDLNAPEVREVEAPQEPTQLIGNLVDATMKEVKKQIEATK